MTRPAEPVDITDEHVIALRALLTGDDDFARLARPYAHGEVTGLDVLIVAAFGEAVQRRFGPERRVADIIGFVATVRAELDPYDEEVDPRRAERAIRAALGDPDAQASLDKAAQALQGFLLTALIAEEHPDEAELNRFLAYARIRAQRLLPI